MPDSSLAETMMGPPHGKPDFVVLKPGKGGMTGNTEDIVAAARKEGLMVVTDETDFEGHVRMSLCTGIADLLDVRVFGGFLSGGLSFGSVFISRDAMSGVPSQKSYDTFADIATFAYSVPLFLMKTVIRYLEELKKLGGIGSVLEKTASFFSMLDQGCFEMDTGIVYIREVSGLESKYRKLRLALLENGIYFPLRTDAPIAVSLAHSDDLVKRSRGLLNSIVKKYLL